MSEPKRLKKLGPYEVAIDPEELSSEEEEAQIMQEMIELGYLIPDKTISFTVYSISEGEDLYLSFAQEYPNSCVIDWGDGTIESTGEDLLCGPLHIYEKGGSYRITITCSKGLLTLGGDMLGYVSYEYGDSYYTYREVRDHAFSPVIRCLDDQAFYGFEGIIDFLPESIEEIDGNAFGNDYKGTTTKIIIPASVRLISYYTSIDDRDNLLAEIHMLSTTPPELTCTDDYFKPWITENNSTVIYVPKGCLEAYRNAPGWSNMSSRLAEEE